MKDCYDNIVYNNWLFCHTYYHSWMFSGLKKNFNELIYQVLGYELHHKSEDWWCYSVAHIEGVVVGGSNLGTVSQTT